MNLFSLKNAGESNSLVIESYVPLLTLDNNAHDNDKKMLEDMNVEIQELKKELHEHNKKLEAKTVNFVEEQFLIKCGKCTMQINI